MFTKSSFLLAEGVGFFLNFAKHFGLVNMLCFAKSFGHRSKTTHRVVFSLLRIHFISRQNKSTLTRGCFCFGGGSGIRTHVGVSPNGFQDRLVMTASISLRVTALLFYHRVLCLSSIIFNVLFFLFIRYKRQVNIISIILTKVALCDRITLEM